ncbi:serine/threonine/tyrosine-interacting protein isoform X1 [Hydra vulgaris]|uniref:Serine/threonine/tyrosine-interacting protein n=1 Tax=Hydra vulgaris TaxID=6087 RepID=T2M8T9_HYDVU|nr:serine/threonine/tyrosine-interacting protein isoform X1 [Hydra vulgaris]
MLTDAVYQSLSFPSLPPDQEEKDWHYHMRRSMQEIVPCIYLGPYAAVTKNKLEVLKEHGITHIVCIRHPIEANLIKPNFPQNFRYLTLDIIDKPTEPILEFFPMVKEFIEECLHHKGKVLIHGNGGISRSASFVIAYIMETYGLSYQKSFLYVQQKRYCINPNEGFVRQLQEYEPIYLARYQQQGQTSSSGIYKRKYEIDDENSDLVKRDYFNTNVSNS